MIQYLVFCIYCTQTVLVLITRHFYIYGKVATSCLNNLIIVIYKCTNFYLFATTITKKVARINTELHNTTLLAKTTSNRRNASTTAHANGPINFSLSLLEKRFQGKLIYRRKLETALPWIMNLFSTSLSVRGIIIISTLFEPQTTKWLKRLKE